MKFQLIPILGKMESFYNQPTSLERFKDYLGQLMGDTKDNMVLPIGGFNPMA